jgi:hypothetical protein
MAFLVSYRLLMSNTFGRIATIPSPQVARGFRELTQVLSRTHLLTAPRRPPRRSALQQQEAVRSTPGFPILSDICLLGLKGQRDHVSERRLRGQREQPVANGRVR